MHHVLLKFFWEKVYVNFKLNILLKNSMVITLGVYESTGYTIEACDISIVPIFYEIISVDFLRIRFWVCWYNNETVFSQQHMEIWSQQRENWKRLKQQYDSKKKVGKLSCKIWLICSHS